MDRALGMRHWTPIVDVASNPTRPDIKESSAAQVLAFMETPAGGPLDWNHDFWLAILDARWRNYAGFPPEAL